MLTIKRPVNKETIAELFKDKQKIMFGGFGGIGTPEKIIDIIIDSNKKQLHLIGIDSGFDNTGVGRLIKKDIVEEITVSYSGKNKTAMKKIKDGGLKANFIPQGILAEKIRAYGAGLSGIISEVGVGTEVENGKTKIIINNKVCLIEEPISADIAIIKAAVCDQYGNLKYNKIARNINPTIATAAKIVIVEAEKIVDVLEPNDIDTPGIYVTYILDIAK